VLDLVLEEFDQVCCNGPGVVILLGVGLRLVGIVALDKGNHLLRVDGNIRKTDAVLGRHDQVRLAAGREISHGDVVQTLKGRRCSVQFNDDLVGHLNEFGSCANTGTGNDSTIFGNGGCFNNSHVQLVSRLVEGVETA
jgi:hypothetical protein